MWVVEVSAVAASVHRITCFNGPQSVSKFCAVAYRIKVSLHFANTSFYISLTFR